MYVLEVHVTMRVYAARECTAGMYTMLRVCDAREFIYKLVISYIGWREFTSHTCTGGTCNDASICCAFVCCGYVHYAASMRCEGVYI